MAPGREDVIQTKLSAPALPLALVPRPRLITRLGTDRARFVLVSAPAGFGKSAVVLDWLRQQPLPYAWLSVDRYDNDATRFFNHLGAAVAGLPLAGAAAAAAVIATLGQRAGEVPELPAALGALAGQAVIVIDDVHELEDEAVLRGLERLLDTRGTGPRIVLVSRTDPPFSLGRLRVSGELLELRERDLRFTLAECGALFTNVTPGGLDASLIEILEQRTEGWAAGLRMAEIVLRNSSDPAAAVASFAGTHRIVVDYLLQEAVEKQTSRVQQFLLDTAVLQRFTAEICAAVTQDEQAGALLSEVEAANLFLVPLGADREWFRYHHLFRELLEFRLRRTNPARLQMLHARAAEWFRSTGDLHAAIEHACELDDRAPLMELLDVYGMQVIVRSELATMERWLRHVPDPLAQPYPMMLVAIAWLRILTERAPDLKELLAAGERALTRVGPDYDAQQHLRAELQLEVLRGFAARFNGRLEEALAINASVLEKLPRDEAFIRGLVIYNQARLHMLFAEMEPAARLLDEGFDYHLRTDTIYLLLTGLGQAATVSAQIEGVFRARERLGAGIAFAQQRHLSALPAYSAIMYHSGYVEYLADDLTEALAAAERAVELGRASHFPEGYANGLLILIRVAVVHHRFDDAEALLTELAGLAQNRNIVLMDSTVDLERFRLALARETCGAGPPLARMDVDLQCARWTLLRETEMLLALQQALRHQDYSLAARYATRLQEESEGRGRGVAYCLALLASTLLPDCADRWGMLEHTLGMAATRGYIRPLLDFGELVRPILCAGSPRLVSPQARTLARTLIERLDAEAGQREQRGAPNLAEPLTAREEEVLRYLFDDMSNKMIARTMFVSGETVKTHLRHLYGKLGAANRQQALSRARELGLAPYQNA